MLVLRSAKRHVVGSDVRPVADGTEDRKRKTRRVDGLEAEVETTQAVVADTLGRRDLAHLGRVAGWLPAQERAG